MVAAPPAPGVCAYPQTLPNTRSIMAMHNRRFDTVDPRRGFPQLTSQTVAKIAEFGKSGH